MNRYLQNTLVRNALLLVALAAGGLTTQFIPSYEEMAALRAQPTTSATPSTASKAYRNSSADVSGNDVSERHLKTAQRTS
jgi:hypothetical protein